MIKSHRGNAKVSSGLMRIPDRHVCIHGPIQIQINPPLVINPSIPFLQVSMQLRKPFRHLASTVFLFIPIFFLISCCRATCYDLDGSIVTDPAFQPCNAIEGAVTVCCATNRTNHFGGSSSDGITADQCLPNGLCHNIIIFSPSSTEERYWRNGCSTSPVDSVHCLDVCTQPDEVVSNLWLVSILPQRFPQHSCRTW